MRSFTRNETYQCHGEYSAVSENRQQAEGKYRRTRETHYLILYSRTDWCQVLGTSRLSLPTCANRDDTTTFRRLCPFRSLLGIRVNLSQTNCLQSEWIFVPETGARFENKLPGVGVNFLAPKRECGSKTSYLELEWTFVPKTGVRLQNKLLEIGANLSPKRDCVSKINYL